MIKKFLNKIEKKQHLFDGFNFSYAEEDFSEHALQAAKKIRGIDLEPSIIIQGVMPRSGTVYVGELLKLHPALCAYPNNMWEVPFLETVGDIAKTQTHFFNAYKYNRERMGKYDFLPLFGASFIAYLSTFLVDKDRLLLKIPDVQYLNLFFKVYPYEHILLLMRDGRDLVSSTIKSWPEKKFSDVCALWNQSANIMLDFKQKYVDATLQGTLFYKYEDILNDPELFSKEACRCFSLDYSQYLSNEIVNIGVRGSSSVKKNDNLSWEVLDKPQDFKSTRHWETWRVKQKNVFKKIAGETLIRAGYEQNNDW